MSTFRPEPATGRVTDPFRSPRGRPRRAATTYLAVLVGGVLGGMARHTLDTAFPAPASGFPWTLLAVNLSGSFALPLLLAVVLERGVGGPLLRPFWATGFLGAYTTFSTYVVAVVSLASHGSWGTAVAYALTSIVGGLALAVVGLRVGTRLVAPQKGSDHASGG